MRRMTLGRLDSRLPSRTWGTAFVFLVAAAWSAPCAAQELGPSLQSGADTPELTPQALVPDAPATLKPHVVRLWEAAIVAGGVGALLADDRHVLHEVREHPTSGAAHVADVFRLAGDIKAYTVLSLGTLGAGLLAKDAGITRTGTQLAASGALAAASFGLLKVVTGRSRPNVGSGAYEFHPFAGAGSFPSGHSAMAFALATTLGDASHATWVTAGLYVIATGTAWSRVYDERHWPSDVFLGAALGVTSAKLVNGRWRLFGLRSPGFLVSPSGAGLQIGF
jgi:membrane-associated phospholipid phosphatase